MLCVLSNNFFKSFSLGVNVHIFKTYQTNSDSKSFLPHVCLWNKQIRRYVHTFMRYKPLHLNIIIIHSFYIVLFSALELTHCAHWHVILNEWLYPFIVHIINIHRSSVLVALCGCWMAGATWNAAISASSVYTIQPCTRLQCHFIQSHIGMCV